jgi:hypothetical protein
MIILSLIFSLCTFLNIACAANDACWQHPKFITPLNTLIAKQSLSQLTKKNQHYIVNDDASLGDAYEADVNNSKKPQKIFISIDESGTAHYSSVEVFQKEGENWQYLGEPPQPEDAGDGPFYFYTYINKITGKNEFITQLCGKIYISFALSGLRDTYIWKNNNTQSACDNDWVNYERQSFKTLYDQHLYNDAYGQLNFYAEKCMGTIKAETYLWLQNDLAFTALKNTDPNQCKVILDKIKQNPAYTNVSDRLKRAVAYNTHLCMQKMAQPTVLTPATSKYQFAWLLDKNIAEQFNKGGPNPFTPDFAIKFRRLLSQVVPSVNGSSFYPYANEGELAATLFDMLEYGDFNILENRYVQFSGCVPHDCATRGFVWIDTETGTSITAIASSGERLYITSKNYNANNVPVKTKEAIVNWYKTLWDDKTFTLPVNFFDFKKNTTVSLPSTWLTS